MKPTLRDGEESDRDQGIAMGPTCNVGEISWRHVNRMILLMPSSDRDSGFVTADHHRHKHCSMSSRICRNSVLYSTLVN